MKFERVVFGKCKRVNRQTDTHIQTHWLQCFADIPAAKQRWCKRCGSYKTRVGGHLAPSMSSSSSSEPGELSQWQHTINIITVISIRPTQADGSRGERVGFIAAFVGLSVRLSVCSLAWYLKNRCSYDQQTSHRNLPPWVVETRLFKDRKVTGQCYEAQNSAGVGFWLFALLWVLASSGARFTKNLTTNLGKT